MRGIEGLFREARRRRVFRVAGVYIIAAWGLLQVLDLAFDTWDYPADALRFVWIGAVLCFPIALVFGWRFDLRADGIVLTPPPDPDDDIDLSLRRFDYVLLACLVVVAAVVSTSIFHQVINIETESDGPSPIHSIAVMPFENMSDSADNEFFSDGLTEETIIVMADMEELRVPPRSSLFYYKDREYTVADVAERLSVDALLEGSVRRQADQVRVTAQLVDAQSEDILWTRTYDRHLGDVFAIEADIARQVADALEIVLSNRSKGRLQRAWTTNPQAHDAYLMGREYLRRPNDKATYEAAVERFESAIVLDTGFAQAHAGLCEARLGQYELTRETKFFELAEAACLRALTRDSEATDTFVALAYLHFFAGQHEQAESEFERVIKLNKTLVDAYLGLAQNYAADQQPERAERAFREAIDLDEAYWDGYQLFGNFLFGRGRYAEAAENYEKVIGLTESNVHAHSNLGAAYYMAGDFQGAANAYKASLEISPSRAGYSNTGTMYYYLGEFFAAAQMYRKALEIAPDDGRMWGNLADALRAGAGTPDEAGEAYGRARDFTRLRLDINPGDAEAMAELAYFSARLGDTEIAGTMLAESLAGNPDAMYTHYYAALIYEQTRQDDEAFGALSKALELGYQPELLRVDPGLRRYSDDERFSNLLAVRGQ